MHKPLVSIIALVFVVVAVGPAAAQRIDQHADGTNFVGDEPSVTSAGMLEYNYGNSPSAAYPADANGLGPERLSTPSEILSVVWNTELIARIATTSTLLSEFAGKDYMVPGTGTFVAWYGQFQDHNGNGWIDDGNRAFDRTHTSAELDCGGTQGLGVVSTNDPNGVGKPQGANTQVSLRCARIDEFTPKVLATGASPPVAYVTPGDWRDYCGDWVNKWAHPEVEADGCGEIMLIDEPRGSGAESPDFAFKGGATESIPTGQYVAPGSGFDYLAVDNSLLMTTVIETISEPKVTTSGPRTHEAQLGSLVEVDIYTSVDPAVESAYQESIAATLAATGCGYGEAEYLNLGCRKTTDPVTEPIRKSGPTGAVGPTLAKFFAKQEQCPNRACEDYSAPHLFMDLYMVNSRSIYGVGLNSPGEVGRDVAPAGDSTARPVATVEIDAVFGVWTDVDGDGWIGTPEYDPTCPGDPYQCGAKQRPHQTDVNAAPDEFTRTCGAKESLGNQVGGSMAVTLTPAGGGDWGTAVYVMTDRWNQANQNQDALRDDGRGMFNPYDDLAHDVAEADGEVDSVVTSGPITLHLTCTAPGGAYESYEQLVFAGPPSSDVTVTADHGLAFEVAGVGTDERVSDTDVYPGISFV